MPRNSCSHEWKLERKGARYFARCTKCSVVKSAASVVGREDYGKTRYTFNAPGSNRRVIG